MRYGYFWKNFLQFDYVTSAKLIKKNLKIKINSSCNNNYHIIPLIIADFWDNYEDITDQVMILCVISVIQYYADIHYYKTPYIGGKQEGS